MCKEPKQNNNEQNQQHQNNRHYGQQNSGKTSAEIAAEQWDSWLGNPDDHESTNNVTKENINP